MCVEIRNLLMEQKLSLKIKFKKNIPTG